ncbi:MAG: biopolymer transporter ExbD [Verrucomicrobia bacterium]|nr:biopolymer transporter ExbD [Verrucomicrobiota bacterium]
MNFRSKLRTDPVGFQLAPMIDVVFLLLCFFMTSQLFAQWETDVPITLPTSKTGQTPRRLPGEVTLNVLKDGVVVVNGQRMDDARLSAMLQRLTSMFPGQPVVLRADKATAYEHVMRVLDLCRQVDIWNVSFATAPPES